MRKYCFFFCLSIALLFSNTLTYSQFNSIKVVIPAGPFNAQEGTQFTLDIKVGEPNAVSNLSGISFNLEWDNTAHLECLTAVPGPFLGSNSLIIAQNISDHIEVGVTSTIGSKSGSGIVVTCTFRIKQNAYGTTTSFNLKNISAIDGSGNPISFAAANNPQKVTFGTVTVSASKSGTGNGQIKLNNSPLALPFTKTFGYGDSVKLEAVPSPNSKFIRWNGDLTGSVNPVTFSLLNNKNIIIEFSLKPVNAPSNLKASATVLKKNHLNWTDNSDNEQGFNVLRKDGDTLSTVPFQVIGKSKANETTYIDSSITCGKQYSYCVSAYTSDSVVSFSNMVSIINNITSVCNETYISDFKLAQNYPNPFNPSTIITYDIPTESKVILKIFNTLGQEISELVNQIQNAGSYKVGFDGSNLTGGVYYYSLRIMTLGANKEYITVKKMSLVK